MTGHNAVTRHRRALRALALLMLLLATAAFLLPIAVSHMPRLQTRIVTAVARRMGGSVRFERLHVWLLPLPHVRLDQIALSFAGTVQGNIEAISAYPKLLPLLSGRIELSRVHLAGADLRIQLPEQPTGGNATPGDTAPSAIENAVSAALANAASHAPGLAVAITRATISLRAGPYDLRLTDMHGEVALPPAALHVDLACASDLWDELSLRGVLNPATFEGNAQVMIARLQLRSVAAPFLRTGTTVDDAAMSLGLGIDMHGLDRVRIDVDASVPALGVTHNGDSARLVGPRLRATWHREGATTRVTLPQIHLDHPQLALSGSLVLAPDGAQLEAQATDLDVAPLRPVLIMLSEEVSVLKRVLDIVQGGHIPRLAFHSSAPSFSGLGTMAALVIDGRLVDGRIDVPGISLTLDDVAGDVKIVGGTLFGEHVSGRLHKARATDGTLRIGLSSPYELAVDTQVDADGAELAGVLRHVVRDQRFQREAERIVDIAGTVSGALRVRGTTRNVTVTAEARSFNVSGRVNGTQLPIRVQGGRFLYTDGGIDASDLLLAVGASTITHATIRLSASGVRDVTATAGRSQIVLNETYPWLLATGWLPDFSWKPESLAGTVSLNSLTARGALAGSGSWRVQASGAAQALVIGSPALQARVAIRFPVSLTRFRIGYDTPTGVSLSADAAIAQGVTGTFDMTWNAGQFGLKRLRLRDAQSDATISLRSTRTERSITFKGNLADTTLRAISEQNLFGGSIHGDFRAALLFDEPVWSAIEGNLEANGLTVPLPGDRYVRVPRFTIDAASGTATVDGTIDGGWGSPLQLRGTIRESPQAFMTDLSVSAGHLDWARIEPWLRRPTGTSRSLSAAAGKRVVQGTVRVDADTFTYRGFTWQPARAVMVLGSGGVTVTVGDARVCGDIVTPGTMTIAPEGITLAFQPAAKDAPVDTLMKCVGVEKQLATGEYALEAQIDAHGQAADLARALTGHAVFTARSGSLYGMSLTAKVLSVLSVATGGWQSLADTAKDGLPYQIITAKADLKDEILKFTEITLEGPSVEWAGEGSVNLAERTVDLTLLVAPLPRVDTVVRHLPLISGVLGGSLVTVPVKVSGPLGDPRITPLSPTAVGEGLLRTMQRTLSLPFTVLQPLLPGTGK